MDEARARDIYTKLVRQADAEDAVIRDRSIKAWARFADATADAALMYRADFVGCIAGASQQERFKDATTLLQSLETESGETHETVGVYAGWIVQWNRWFRQRQIKLKMMPITATAALAMLKEIDGADWDDDDGFKLYCRTTPNPHREIYDMREAFRQAGLAMTNVYAAMHFLQQHVLPIDKLKTSTAKDIHYLSILAPPLTVFAGFADWGPGNHGNPTDNKKNHFLKHVLDASAPEPLPWQGECGVWWQKLDIRLTRQTAEATLSSLQFNLVKNDFPPEADGRLPFGKVAGLVGAVKANGGWPILLLNQLVADYQDRYTSAAITMSQSMTGVIVHTDNQGGKVMMMGLNGDFFLGGRMEGATLGLSTCFVPRPDVDKSTVNQAYRIWRVSPV